MAITANRLRRAEIWSTWVAAGGVRQAVVDDATVLTATSNIAGSDQLNLTLPLVSPATPYVVPNAVIRIEESDSVFDEWLILEGPNDDDGSGLRQVQGLPIRAAMATCELVRRIDSDGTSLLDFESVGLTPAEHIAAWVIPALTRGGMAWVAAGTITPTKLLDLTFASDTPLSVLQRIADQTGMELDIRRTGGGYAIDIIAEIGSAQPTADLRFDKNLQPGTKRNRSSLESATRVFPIGADEEGRRATMSRATWKVTNIAGLIVTLADPAGGAGPIQFDGQLAGLNGTTAAFLRKPGGTLTAVTASSFANQTVTVASVASLAVGDLVQFRADSAGSDLIWLDSPPDRLLYGLKVAPVEMSDVPSTNNLLKNAVMRAWPGAPTSPPTNWTQIGGGTVARQAASPYTRVGGFSIHRVGVSDGDGVISDAVPIFPTALKPYISGYAGLWVVSGQVRVELVFTTGGGPVVQPLPPDFATNSLLGQWEDLGAAGIDANVLGATAVALRVVQHGATVADFYLDYGQVTESSSQLPLAESSGGTRLWQAANEALRTNGAPLVSYAMQIVDLANIDPATWGADCKVVVGGKVRVTDPRLTIAIVTRLVELVRDYKVWGDTKVTLSNKPDDMTGSLSRPLAPPRALAGASDTIAAPAPPVLSASFDATGQLIINSSGDFATASQKIAWATGAAPSAATVRAASPIAQQNVSGLATGSVYPAGTTVFIAAFAYSGNGLESTPLAVISVTREGSGVSAAECLAKITGTTATTVTVTVTANPASPVQQVQYVAVTGSATLSSGTAAGTWVTPNGTNNVWVFNRAAINAGVGQAQFRAGNVSSYQNDDDFVSIEEQGRDTVPLQMRARIIASDATTATVRVAVADPYPQGAGSATIAYTETGGTGTACSPASGGTVTPAATLTEAAGTYIDYTVTRPNFATGTRRVTFTVTAASRTSDSDAVDVPELAGVGAGLSAPPFAFVYPTNGETDDLFQLLTFNAVAGSGGGGTNLTYAVYQKIGFAAETTIYSGNATTLPRAVSIARHPRSEKNLRFRVTDTATGLFDEATWTVPSARQEVNDTGNPFRNIAFDDADYSIRSTNNTGLLLHGSVLESGTKPVNRLYAKALAADVDSFDSVIDGTTYARPLSSRINAGKPVIDFTEAIHTAKNIDNIADTATRFAAVLNEKAGGVSGIFSGAVVNAAGWVDVTNVLTAPAPLGEFVGSFGGFAGPLKISFDALFTGGIFDLLLYAGTSGGSGVNGYGFRFDSRNAVNAGQILIFTNGTWSSIGTAKASVNAGALSGWHQVTCLYSGAGQFDIFVDGVWQYTAADATYTLNGGLGYGREIANGQIRNVVISSDLSLGGFTNTAGGLVSTATESGLKPINRLFAKALAADADTLDSAPDGTTYKKVTGVVSSLITPASSTTRRRCRVYHSADQSIGNSAATTLDFDSESWDVGGLHSTGTNPSRITIPAGMDVEALQFMAHVEWAANGTGYRQLNIIKNGTLFAPGSKVAAVVGGGVTTQQLVVIDNAPTATDYYQVQVLQTSGGNLNANGSGPNGSNFAVIHLW